jgi:hypothetical protein
VKKSGVFVSQENIDLVVSMGFTEKQARFALEKTVRYFDCSLPVMLY